MMDDELEGAFGCGCFVFVIGMALIALSCFGGIAYRVFLWIAGI